MKNNSGNKKANKIIPILLLAVDVVLLGIILKSYNAQNKKEPVPGAQAESTVVNTTGTKESPSLTPSIADFSDWYITDAMWNGVPGGVEKITDFDAVKGEWKGLIYYDPSNTDNSEAMELLVFTVGGTAASPEFKSQPVSIYRVAEGKNYPEEDKSEITYPSTWENGVLTADRDDVIIFTDFFTKDGKQYA